MAARILIGLVFLLACIGAIVYVGRSAPPRAARPVADAADTPLPTNPTGPPAPPVDETPVEVEPQPTAPPPEAPAEPAPAPPTPAPAAEPPAAEPSGNAVVVPSGESPKAYGTDPGLHALVFTRSGVAQPVNYLLFLPSTYRTGGRLPLIFYLHGKSLCGDDPQMLLKYGIPKIVSRNPAFPFIVIAPQCRTGQRWTDVETLDALLSEVVAHYPVDTSRIYLAGYSMGAGGVWRFGGSRPGRFAAAVALAGVEETVWAKGLARVPVWVFHGTDDADVPASGSQAMVDAIRAAGGDARLELLPGRDHNIVDVFDRKDLYDWLLAHRREK